MLESRKFLERVLAVCVDTQEYQATQDTMEYPGVTAEMEPKEIQVRRNAQILTAFKSYHCVMYELRYWVQTEKEIKWQCWAQPLIIICKSKCFIPLTVRFNVVECPWFVFCLRAHLTHKSLCKLSPWKQYRITMSALIQYKHVICSFTAAVREN